MRLLVTIDQAAEYLSISRSSMRRLINAGEIRVVRVGSSPRIVYEDLVLYVNELVERLHGKDSA